MIICLKIMKEFACKIGMKEIALELVRIDAFPIEQLESSRPEWVKDLFLIKPIDV